MSKEDAELVASTVVAMLSAMPSYITLDRLILLALILSNLKKYTHSPRVLLVSVTGAVDSC
jgi:hypothetical protein